MITNEPSFIFSTFASTIYVEGRCLLALFLQHIWAKVVPVRLCERVWCLFGFQDSCSGRRDNNTLHVRPTRDGNLMISGLCQFTYPNFIADCKISVVPPTAGPIVFLGSGGGTTAGAAMCRIPSGFCLTASSKAPGYFGTDTEMQSVVGVPLHCAHGDVYDLYRRTSIEAQAL